MRFLRRKKLTLRGTKLKKEEENSTSLERRLFVISGVGFISKKMYIAAFFFSLRNII